MTILRRVQGASERMDDPDVDPSELEAALRHVTAVNRWLGARRALTAHLPWALPAGRCRVLDVGTGAADLMAVAAWARGAGRPVRITAVEPHEATLAVAHRRARGPAGSRRRTRSALRHRHVRPGPPLHDAPPHERPGAGPHPGRAAPCRTRPGVRAGALPNYLGARLLVHTVWRHPSRRPPVRAALVHPGRAAGPGPSGGAARSPLRRHLFYRLVLRAEA
jgi:SAM-dependent methyltransferase